MKNNISLLAGLKNNLAYSKNFYYTTRALYPDIEIIFTSYNSTDGTHEWLDSLHDDHLVYYYATEDKTFSDTFNKCTQLATREFVVFTHNDVVLTPGFIENIEKHAADNVVIYYTTIEPPIFSDDERPGKIVKNFGIDIDTLDLSGLYAYSLKMQEKNKGATVLAPGTSFFLCASRAKLLALGGLDPLYNPMFCEDDDLILRLRLTGLKIFTALDAICYHFVSKTSRFSAEYETRTKGIEINSNKNFVRKWGFKNSSPIKKKYDVGLVVQNGNETLLAQLEPWCSVIYIDCNSDKYVAAEQPSTLFNLHDRIKPLNSPKSNDILINFNGNAFNEKTFELLKHMTELITRKINEPTSFFAKLLHRDKLTFKTSIFSVQILNPISHEDELIVIKP
jgi:GT2 family glycosyltransferase